MTTGSTQNNPLINVDKIREMLFNEEKYVLEFAEASIESFSEFSEHYHRYLLDRNLEEFQKAGHKIKPVAQILELEQILSEYRNAKKDLQKNVSDEKLLQSARTVQEICKGVISEFHAIVDDLS